MENKNYYIYFYYQNDEIIYIGKTTNLKSRHQQHMLEKNFILNPYTHISILPCQTKIDMDILEKYFISLYTPRLNIIDTNKGTSTLCISQSIPEKIDKNNFENFLKTITNNNNNNKINSYDFILHNISIITSDLKTKINNKTCKLIINPNNWINYNLNYSQFRLLFWLIFIYQLNNNNNNFSAQFQLFNEAANLAGHGGGAIYRQNLNGLQVLKNLNLLHNNSTSSCIIFTNKMIELCNNLNKKIIIEFCSFFQKNNIPTTKYSIKLFLLLMTNDNSIVYYNIDELKNIFNPNENSDITKEFTRHKLYPAVNELNTKSIMNIQLQPVKQNKKNIGYNFIINKEVMKNGTKN